MVDLPLEKIRISNIEIRKKFELQKIKFLKHRLRSNTFMGSVVLIMDHSCFEFVSSFVLCVSDLKRQ